MRIILSQSKEEAVNTVANMVIEKIESHPNAVLGLATGKTMEPVYEAWINLSRARKLNHEKCFFFMLDEYLGIDVDHPSSFKSYIKKRLIRPLGLTETQFAFPPVHLVNSGSAGGHYENLLQESGGIDLQLLGLGQNGHIGFNEPGSLKNSLTRKVEVTDETREANRLQFEKEIVPKEALSMGIGSIIKAKNLVMLALGNSKADAIKYLMNHHDDPTCPVTFLKDHPHFTLVLDPGAAAKISLKI